MPLREIDILLDQMKEHMDQRRFTNAIQIGRTLLTLLTTSTPQNRALVRYNLGVCYNELGRYAEAETEYAESLRENPTDPDTWYNRANNYHHWAGRGGGSRSLLATALQYARRAQQLNPSDGDIPRLIASIQATM